MKKDLMLIGLLAAGVAGLIMLQKRQQQTQKTEDLVKRSTPFSSPEKTAQSPYCKGGT